MKTEKFKTLFYFTPKSKVKAGDGLDEGNFPFYTSSFILKKRINKAQYFDEALIFGTGGSASVHFANEPFGTSTDCLVAMPKKENLNIKFTYYYLYGNIHLLEKGFKGAGLRHISKTYIEELEIPIFPIDIQNKIVAVLDRANHLVNNRKKTIKLLEELLRATFLQMFGDIASFKKTENSSPLGNYISVKHGYAFKSENFATKGKYVLLSPGNFSETGGFKERGNKQKYYVGEFPSVYILKKGDLLIAMTEQAPGLLGSPLLVPEDNKFLHNQRLGLIEGKKDNINIVFFFYLFNMALMKNIIHVRSNGVKVRHTSPTKIEEIQVTIPDEESQKKFSNYAKSIEEAITKNKESEIFLNILFNSILQKSFNGQLNLNIDIELDALINEIDLQNKSNDLSKISGDIAYLQILVDRLNTQDFKSKDLYDKAKHAAFQLMTIQEDKRQVTQEYNKKRGSIELVLK